MLLLIVSVLVSDGRAQWPGSYCDTKQSCCYPQSGKPAADFGIHGLWPNRDDGSYPQNCDPNSEFDPSKVPAILFLSLAANLQYSYCSSMFVARMFLVSVYAGLSHSYSCCCCCCCCCLSPVLTRPLLRVGNFRAQNLTFCGCKYIFIFSLMDSSRFF